MFGERDSKFFYLFETAAANASNAAQVLRALTCDLKDREKMVAELEELEHRGDELTHDIIAELNRTFITPIDREDIFLIAKETDNILDAIETTAHRFVMLDIKESTEAAQQMAQLIVDAASELATVMHSIRKLKQISKNNQSVVEINRLENEGDRIYRQAVKALYTGNTNVMDVIKWREIYDKLEQTLDALEDVANIVEGIAMKHS